MYQETSFSSSTAPSVPDELTAEPAAERTVEKMNAPRTVSGAVALMETLLQVGVETIFGYPGGAIMPVYDALYDYRDRIHHVLVRH